MPKTAKTAHINNDVNLVNICEQSANHFFSTLSCPVIFSPPSAFFSTLLREVYSHVATAVITHGNSASSSRYAAWQRSASDVSEFRNYRFITTPIRPRAVTLNRPTYDDFYTTYDYRVFEITQPPNIEDMMIRYPEMNTENFDSGTSL